MPVNACRHAWRSVGILMGTVVFELAVTFGLALGAYRIWTMMRNDDGPA